MARRKRPTSAELHFFAGLFCGEGCFVVRDVKGVPGFALKLEMTDRAMVEFCRRFGGDVRVGGKVGVGSRLAESYSWYLFDGYAIVALVERMYPLLRGGKRKQAAAYLRFAKTKLRYWERRDAAKRRAYTPAELRRLYTLAQAARAYAGGGMKGWRARWTSRMQELTHA